MAYASFGDGTSTGAPLVGSGQSSSSSYFPQAGQLPSFLQNIISALQGESSNAAGQYNNYVSNPTASPLYQNSLSGLLAALAPGEDTAARNLTDQFRSAGNLASGAFGTAASQLQGDIAQNHQTLASQLLAQQFPQMVQALMNPQSLMAQLGLGTKLSQGFGAGSLNGFNSGSLANSFLNSGFSDPWAELGMTNPQANPNYNMGGGFSGVNAPAATPGAPAQDPFAQLNTLLGGGGSSGGGSIYFDPSQNMFTNQPMTTTQAFQPFTSTDFGMSNPS